MSNVKTVTLAADAVTSVSFEASYPYYWVDNQSDGVVYATVGAEPVPDTDGTFTVDAGGKIRLSGGITPAEIKLKGSGKVQVHATGIAESPFKECLKGGEIASIKQDIKIIRDVVNGVTHSFETDSTTAYSKPVPVGARLAGVKKLGGMTIKENDSLIASPVTALHSTIDGRTIERTQIPDEIIALEGYGDGINAAFCNYIDFEEKKYYKCVGVVDLGTLNWTEYTNAGSNHTFKAGILTLSSNIGICSKYDVGENNGITDGTNNGIWLKNNSNGTISIYLSDSAYTDVEAFKAAMSGVILYYGLTEPIITDISDMLTADFNIIDVIPGGQLTFENENNIAIPSEVEYVVALAEVLNNE